MTQRDWDRARRRKAAQKARKRQRERVVDSVHPNSMAARKWGRTTWERYKR